jgi:hypothetical protein
MRGSKAGARDRREADSQENDGGKKAGHGAAGIFIETDNGRGGQKKAARWIPRG